jgi:hypothetical protein
MALFGILEAAGLDQEVPLRPKTLPPLVRKDALKNESSENMYPNDHEDHPSPHRLI